MASGWKVIWYTPSTKLEIPASENCSDCNLFDNSGGEYRDLPTTNADRIRAMSDEELADFLTEFSLEAFAAGAIKISDVIMDAHQRLEWLQQPTEEVYRND